MRDELARRVAEAAKLAGIAAPALPPGPAAAAAAEPAADATDTAADIPAPQREKLVRDMVAQLAAKLDKAPDDSEGWLRLGRAYLVLNEATKADDAYARARQLKPNDADVKLREAEARIDTLHDDATVPEPVVQLLRDAEAAEPAKPEPYWYLGIAAARNRDTGEATKQWQHLLTLVPADNEDHKNVQTALDSLR